jgi:two-component system NtrC family sensor kinase
LLSFFSLMETIAQNNLPPVYEIRTDSILHDTLLNNYWQVLSDKDGKLSFYDISRQPIVNRFHDTTKRVLQTDLTIHCFWFRYVLKNATDHTAKVCFGEPFLSSVNEESDFYFIDSSGRVTHVANGLSTPWTKLTGIKEYRLLPVELKPSEQLIVYRRIFNSKYFSPGANVWVGFSSTEKMMNEIYALSQTAYLNAIHDIFIFGVLMFAAIFVFFFFIITREKSYLYFSLYLLALGIGRFNTNLEMFDVFFRQYPLLYAYIYPFIWVFSIFFLVHFIRHLLNTKYYLPRWNKFLIVFSLLYAVTFLTQRILAFWGVESNMVSFAAKYTPLILPLTVPVTFLLCLKWIKTNKVLTWIILPLQSIWSISLVYVWIYDSNPNSGPPNWLEANWYPFETVLLSCLVVSFSWVLLQRFSQLRKQVVQKELEKEIERNELIAQQKIELEKTVEERTAELKQSLQNLRSTQAQLIQSEKMASLGELTAGIAHEIQNPLNFVNNFSEVNKELIEELKIKNEKLKIEELDELLDDIAANEQKINHHGKRADAIVKGMLQHSRKSEGKKEPTDINALCGEYLRLSYHGLRAKDKDFNAEFKTDFDATIGKINVVPQDIGRVLLNLFNNAFYAVSEKNKDHQENYEPTVSVSTKKNGDKVLISVADNGNGIPQNVLDKIFQPFFTTKPTGEGTGLGLSLSYDIIKAHGGEIKVETKDGEGSQFIIQLPTE